MILFGKKMTTLRLSIIGLVGSICAFGLTYCGYPMLLFGTGAFARIAWPTGWIAAALFALLLLGVLVRSVIDVAIRKSPMLTVMIPAIPLSVACIAWWRLYILLLRMP